MRLHARSSSRPAVAPLGVLCALLLPALAPPAAGAQEAAGAAEAPRGAGNEGDAHATTIQR